MKNVLMIAYAFPPMGGPGVQRALKFAKYLPQHSWKPVILTADAPNDEWNGEVDYSLLQEIPDAASVHRAPDPRLREVLSALASGSAGSPGSSHDDRRATLGGHARALAKSVLFLPDAQAEWIPRALLEGVRILRGSRVEAIWSTSDPFSNHIVGYLLKRLCGVPWVSDWRDPWTLNEGYHQRFPWRRRADRELERLLLRGADRVIVTCWALADALLTAYPSLEPRRVLEITNGYDPGDFQPGRVAQDSDGRLVITFAGRFESPHNRAVGFLHALNALRSQGLNGDTLTLRIVGATSRELKQLIEDLRLQDMVELFGYQPHAKCIELLMASDVLLLSVAHGRGHDLIYPGKLFEYLYVGKPILALVTQGATAALLAKLGVGVVVPPDDVERIADAVRGLHWAKANRHMPAFDTERIGTMFERRALTRKLAQCLDEVAKVASSLDSP